MLFNLTTIFDWRAVTARKQQKVNIDNVCKHSRQVRNDIAIVNIVYVKTRGIYQKLYYNKQGPYIITAVFTNGTVQVNRGAINEPINIRRLVPHFESAEPVPLMN